MDTRVPPGLLRTRICVAVVLAGWLLAPSAFGSSKHFDVRLSMGAERNNRLVTVTDDFVEEIGPTTSQQNSDLALLDTELEFSLRRASRRHTLIRVRGTAYRYTEASDRDFESFRLSLVQELNDTGDDLSEVRALRDDLTAKQYKIRRSFSVINRSRLIALYLTTPGRTLRDAIEIDDGLFDELSLDRHTVQVRYIQRLNRGERNRFSMDLALAHDMLDYSTGFDERDSNRERVAVGGNYFRRESWGFWGLEAGLQFSDLRSNTGMIGQPGRDGPIVADLSYDSVSIPVGVRFDWYSGSRNRPMSRRNRARLLFSYGEKTYDSAIPDDADRFAREDRFWILGAQYVHPIRNDLVVDFWGEYRVDRTTFDPLLAPGIDVVQPPNNVVVGIALSFYTGWEVAPDASAKRHAKRRQRPETKEAKDEFESDDEEVASR